METRFERMGFFKNAVKVFKETMAEDNSRPDAENIKLTFGGNYIMESQRIKEAISKGTWRGGGSIEVDFDQELLREINDCVETHSGNSRVLYSDNMQFLDVVGEGFRQEELRKLYNKVQDSWLSGVLMPEPLNPHDSNAVSVLVIVHDEDPENPSNQFRVIQAGHLKRDQAAKVFKKLMKFAMNDQYIPILCKLMGGTLDKPNLGLLARAKTSALEF
jgi:hypothetical protein